MKKQYSQLIALFLFCLLSLKTKAQLDTTFWFAAPDFVVLGGAPSDRPILLRISTAGQASRVKISIPANPSFSIPPLNIGANSSQSIDLTAYIDIIENGLVDVKMSRGLLIESTTPISCYYDIFNTRSGDIFALKGRNALGLKFTVPFQMEFNNRPTDPNNTNDFVVLATENNTTIQIKPKNDLINHPAGISFPITLQKGETYMCRAANNIPSQRPGGTIVTANKPISISIKEDLLQYPGAGCADASGDQLIADDIAGQEFIVVKGRFSNGNPDYYYVFATEDNTSIKVNNTIRQTLKAGEYYVGNLYDESCFVETSAPAHLLHVSGFGCEVGMAIIPSIKCTGSTRVNTTRASASEDFYLNVIAPKEIIGDFTLNNDPTLLNSSLFLPVPGTNTNWMYLRFKVDASLVGTNGNVTIENPKGKFHAGIIQGNTNSTTRYGYFSDFSINTVLLSDPKDPSAALKDTTIVCYNADLKIDALNQAATSYNWIGPNGFTYTGQQLNINAFNTENVGEYTVTSSGTGCGNASKKFVLAIDKPAADFNFIANGCEDDPVSFSTSSIAGVRWIWDFGNNNILDTLSAIIPARKLSGTGDISVSMKVASERGCFSEPKSKIVSLSSKPLAKYTIPTITCINDQINFTDASSIVSGTIKKWSWDLNDTRGINTYTNNDPQIARYTSSGKKDVKLFVESQTGCVSDTFSLSSFIVNPLPNPGFILPEVCLNDALANFIDTSKSSDGYNSFSYKWNFNAGAIPINPGPVYTTAQTEEKNPAIEYRGPGKYLVKLIVNSRGCIDSISKTFKVNGANPEPAFEVIQPTSLCSNDSIRIKNLSTIDFDDVTRLEIFWDAQDLTLKTIDETPFVGKTYAFRYQNFQSPANKKINITLRAFSGDALSCSKEITKEITLYASPKVNFNLMPGICLNASPRQITEAIADPLVAGSFIYTGKGVDATGLFNPASAGISIHTIKAVYKSATTTCVDSAENTIRVWDIPKASFDVSALKCEKNNTVFTSTSVANEGALTKWIWNFGDGNNPTTSTNNQPLNHVYSTWKNYDASLQVETDKGCLSPLFNLAIKINPLPKVGFTTANFCLPNAKALFTNTSSIADGQDNLMTYRWDFGDVLDPSTDLTKNGQHTYKLVGPYNVKLIATSVDNCRDSTTELFDKIFEQPKAGFSSLDSICIGTAILLKDTSKIVNGQIVEWYWDLGDNTKSNLDQFSHTFTSSKEYTISHFVKTSIGCLSDTISKIISIWDYPKISAGPDLLVLNDGEKKIESSASGNHANYKWSPSIYLSAPDSLQPFIQMPQEDQIYTLTVAGRGKCISTDQMKMTVLKLPKPTNTFTPNGDGINDTWEIPYLNQYTNCILEIYATTGQMLFRSIGYPKNWDGKYNGNELPTGTYYYVIDPKNGRKKLTGYITILR